MFGTVAAAGLRIIMSNPIDRKATLVLAISFGMGLGVECVPGLLSQTSPLIQSIFSNGITTGGITAMIANACIRLKE